MSMFVFLVPAPLGVFTLVGFMVQNEANDPAEQGGPDNGVRRGCEATRGYRGDFMGTVRSSWCHAKHLDVRGE